MTTILYEFQQALQTAIIQYQAEIQVGNKKVSDQDATAAIKLQAILAESSQVGKRNALLLRRAVTIFLQGLLTHPIARLIPALFGSKLYQTIRAVLEQPEYSEAILIGRGLAENDEREERILGYLRLGDTGKLITTIENLENQLKTKEKTCADLTTQCQILQNEKTHFTTENQRLFEENQKLKVKLAQFENIPANQKQEQIPSGVFISLS